MNKLILALAAAVALSGCALPDAAAVAPAQSTPAPSILAPRLSFEGAGFSFSHPRGWIVGDTSADAAGTLAKLKTADTLGSLFVSFIDGAEPLEWHVAFEKEQLGAVEIAPQVVGGISARVVQSLRDDRLNTKFIVQRGGKTYRISITLPSDQSPAARAAADEMAGVVSSWAWK